MKGLHLGIALVFAIAAFAPLVVSAQEASPTPAADAQYFDVQLVNVTTSYGQERWKQYPPFYASNPQAGLMNGTGQFDGAVGYRVSLKVKLVNEDGTPVSATDPELPNVNMTAWINAPTGPLYAYIQRNVGDSGLPVQSNSPFFTLHFDVDGTDVAPPGGRAIPPLLAGAKYVKVDIFKRGLLPNQKIPAGETDLVFDYNVAAVQAEVPSLGTGNLVAEVPGNMFRLFNDIGYDRGVAFVHKPVASSDNVTLTWRFGVPLATVKVWALAAERLCNPPSCIPGGPGGVGTVEIHRKMLVQLRTDSNGTASLSVPASQLLQFPAKAYTSGIIVVAATLSPEDDLPTPLGEQFLSGSAAIRTGAREIVIPVSTAPLRVTGFALAMDSQNQTNQIPNDPLANLARGANALEVQLYDDAGQAGGCGVNCGDAVAIQLKAQGPAVLAQGSIAASQDPNFAAKYRVGRIPVKPIQDLHVTAYRVVMLLYQPRDEFYGLAFADRGYNLELTGPTAYVGQTGTLWLNFTSVTTNYDLRAAEPGFQLRVLTRVAIPDLRVNRTETIVLPEAGFQARAIPVVVNRSADVRINVWGVTGDTVSDTMSVNGLFRDPPPKKSLADRIPGFEAILGITALAALAIGWRLLRRRGEAF